MPPCGCTVSLQSPRTLTALSDSIFLFCFDMHACLVVLFLCPVMRVFYTRAREFSGRTLIIAHQRVLIGACETKRAAVLFEWRREASSTSTKTEASTAESGRMTRPTDTACAQDRTGTVCLRAFGNGATRAAAYSLGRVGRGTWENGGRAFGEAPARKLSQTVRNIAASF